MKNALRHCPLRLTRTFKGDIKTQEVAMNRKLWRTSSLVFLFIISAVSWAAQDIKTIKLNEPNKKRGLPVMEALSVRASVRDWSDKDLSVQDLSDLLWAANGINRPESKKRTASSAMNSQDVDIYVFMKDGAFLYDAGQHALNPVAAGDHRAEVTMRPGGGPGGPPPAKPEGPPPTPPGGGPGGPSTPAPIQIILVSDISRFSRGTQELKLEWAAIDTGIVSQNISLFCAATGLATRPRAGMNKDLIKSLLKLTETQFPILNHPVGYPKGNS
jgi:nitroreductase